MAYGYSNYRRPAGRAKARRPTYRPSYSRAPTYSRRPAGSNSGYSRKKTKRYGRPKARSYVVTPKNGFVAGAPLSQYQLAQIDAFDPRAVGVKIPDSNATPSCGVMVSDDLNLGAPGANLAICYAFQPSVASTMISGVGSTTQAWTWPAAWAGSTASGKSASIGSNYDLYRPVAHGIRISSSISATAATGFVHIAVYPSRTTRATWDFPTNLAGLSDCMWYTRITLSSLTQTPYVIQNKFLDCTAQRYIDTTNLSNSIGDNPTGGSRAGVLNVANEWCTVLIALEGTNASGVLTAPVSVETLVHYEALPSPGGVQAGGPAAMYDVADLQGAAAAAANLDPVNPVSPGGTQSVLRAGVSQVAAATGNFISDVVQNVAPSAREVMVGLAAGAVSRHIQPGGANSQNHIGRLTN